MNEKKKEQSQETFRTNTKCASIWIIGVPEEEEKGKGPEEISEDIIVKKFSNMGKEIVTPVQEGERV